LSRSLRRRLTVPVLALAFLVPLVAAQPAGAFVDRDCSDFSTQRQAQHFFETHHPRRDPHRLDADHDGIACESLP
jgi:excalibur calcium-binding domain-containing protein